MASIKLSGSEREVFADAKSLGAADPAERLEVSVLLRRQGADLLKQHLAKLARGERPERHMAREEFARRFGTAPKDFAKLRKFAAKHGLAMTLEHAARRTAMLAGTVSQFDQAFGIKLQHYSHAEGTYRGHAGAIKLPAELRGVVQAVLGLDNRPQARPHFRRRATTSTGPRLAAGGSFTPVQLASLYGFPAGD